MNFLDEAKKVAGDVCEQGNEIVNDIPADKVRDITATDDVQKPSVDMEKLAGMNDEVTKACLACQGNEKEAHTCIA